MSEKLGVPVEHVDRIINFQFADIRLALGEYATVEISRFCKFVINQSKLKRVEAKYINHINVTTEALKDETLPDEKREKLTESLAFYKDSLIYIGTKYREQLPPTRHKEMNRLRKEARLKAEQAHQASQEVSIEEAENNF